MTARHGCYRSPLTSASALERRSQAAQIFDGASPRLGVERYRTHLDAVDERTETEPTSRSSIERRAVDQGPVLYISTHGITDVGRVREHNEDSFVIAEIRRVLRIRQSSLAQPASLMGERLGHLLMVADGMGGHQAGEYASAMALASVENIVLNTIGWLFRLRGEGVLVEFQDAIRATDRWVIEAAQQHAELRGMGTTLTMGYVT